MKEETRDVGALSIRASVQPASAKADTRTVDVLWTVGARVLRYGWTGPYYEELSLDPAHVRMGRLNNGAPFLNAHNSYDLEAVIGVVEAGSAKLNSEGGTATIRFAKAEDDEDADRIFRKVQDGIIQNVSVGYRVYAYEEVARGDDEIPVYRAVDWEPFEISAVPVGADDDAGFRSDEKAAKHPCVIRTRSNTTENETMTDEEKKAAAAEAEKKRQAEDLARSEAAAKEAAEAATKAATERAAGINQLVRMGAFSQDEGDVALRGSDALDVIRARALDNLAKRDVENKTEQRGVTITADEHDKFLRGAGDWLLTKAAVGHMVTAAAKARGEEAKLNAGEFRGMSLVDLARESLERRGVKVRGMDKMRLVGEALTYRGITQSTSDFAVLLENTMHKVLLAAYAITPDTWTRFCAVGSVSDFRAHNRYRMGTFGRLEQVKENAEFKNKSIPDATKESVQAATFGNLINLSRQAIINDDMGAFNRLGTMLGRASKLSIEVDVYALLAMNAGLGPNMADGKTLFHADHANIGTGAALTMASVDADRVVMASQKDRKGNEYLDLRPAVLALPIGLGGTARTINEAQYDPDTANKLQKPNSVRGLYNDIVDTPRIAGTRRYSFADPNVAPTLEVSFLDGVQEPYMETRDGWNVDGVEWKVRVDYAVGAVDYVGAVTNAGQ